MKLTVPALAPLLPFLTGCIVTIGGTEVGNDDEAETSDTTTTTTGDEVGTTSTTDTTSTDTDSESSSSDTGTESSTDTTTDTGTGTGTESGTDTSTDTGTDTGTETGDPIELPPDGYCGMSAGPVDPWVSIDQYGQAVDPGGHIDLECGGQGSWMFRLNANMGGFEPMGKLVPIQATLDVEGYNIGPNGHFAATPEFNWFLGCCDDPNDYELYNIYCYYQSTLTLFPPDAIPDLAVLDGLPATLTVTTTTPEGIVDLQLDVNLWAMYEPSWELCLYEYYDGLPPLEISMPIPHD